MSDDSSVSHGEKDDTLLPYALETESKQAELLLGWILGKDYRDGTEIEDACISLAIKEVITCKNKSNLLRIMEANMELIQKHVSTTVFRSLKGLSLSFKNKKLKWACNECDNVIDPDSPSWECCRCLLWFHERCQTKYSRELPRKFQYCKNCYIG